MVGNSVSVAAWNEIWLNEGFAKYFEYMWDEHEGTKGTLDDRIKAFYYKRFADPANPIWQIPPTAPGEYEMFGDSVYARGAMTLHVLRKEVGDDMFFRIMRNWVTTKKYGNATTQEFTALAKQLSGDKNLDKLFQDWLYGTTKPASFPA